MLSDRVLPLSAYLQPCDGEPIRSIMQESIDATVVAWHVHPGQRIAPHIHPQGQDTWTILSGTGDYQLDAAGSTVPVGAGDVVVAQRGAVHGVHNTGSQSLVFVSVVCPAEAGFEPLAGDIP